MQPGKELETGKNDWQHSQLLNKKLWKSYRKKFSSSMMKVFEGTWNRLNKEKKKLLS
uniref:Macaca fascicularis brain cDNA clone: QorA-11359, similar to human zinc finger protein 291 (ZNF291), mRNA, RefSeq: NM_020843.1 n=1 Tax=Macaca fascicularis TaxID=9541 RepID=Q4R8K8_MACFA|nr:unnamed protein product [Macaca fascicularis]BAE88015.1 unnamed protein product [Macaca fascicularis]